MGGPRLGPRTADEYKEYKKRYDVEYRKKHKERIEAYQKKWVDDNLDHVRAVRLAWREKNRARLKAKSQKYYQEHREEHRERRKENSRRYREENPGARLKTYLKGAYGLTTDDYDAMLKAQDGVCAVCSMPEVIHPRLSVDHDHVTGIVRALLCHHCNAGLGHFRDDPSRLRSAAEYLELHRRPRLIKEAS